MRTKEEIREYKKEYYKKPEVKKRTKEYYQRPEAKSYHKEHYQKNKEKIKEYNQKPEVKKRTKKYYQEYENKIKEQKKKWYQKNKDKIKEKGKKYYQENQEEIKKCRKKYFRKRLKTDMNFRIRCNLRTRLWMVLKKYTKIGKVKKSKDYGIDYKKIIKYLKPFPKDLSKYHVDHIRPLCSFNFINEDGSQNLEEIRKAFAPENYQWLTIQENLIKGGKILK